MTSRSDFYVPGMQTTAGPVDDDYEIDGINVLTLADGSGLPPLDVGHPASIGCLTDIMRQKTGDPHARARFSNSRQMWMAVWRTPYRAPELGPDRCAFGFTEADAIFEAINEAEREGGGRG